MLAPLNYFCAINIAFWRISERLLNRKLLCWKEERQEKVLLAAARCLISVVNNQLFIKFGGKFSSKMSGQDIAGIQFVLKTSFAKVLPEQILSPILVPLQLPV